MSFPTNFRSIRIRDRIRCPSCEGNGRWQSTNTCSKCKGSGKHSKSLGACFRCEGKGTTLSWNAEEVKCLRCDGTGQFYPICRECEGRGETTIILRVCRECAGEGNLSLTKAIGQLGSPEYVQSLVQELVRCSSAHDLPSLECGLDIYLVLKEAFGAARATQPPRDSFLFPNDLIDGIKLAIQILKESREREYERQRDEKAKLQQAKLALLEEEEKRKKESQETRDFIKSLGIPEWDFE